MSDRAYQWDLREAIDNSGDGGRPVIGTYYLMVKWDEPDPWVDVATFSSLTYAQIVVKQLNEGRTRGEA